MINAATIALVKKFEGLYLQAYPDPATKAEPWTIGYGHTTAAGLPKVRRGIKIDRKQAEDILMADLTRVDKALITLLRDSFSDNQRGALISFAFNCGVHALAESTLLRLANAGNIGGAADEFLKWTHANGKVMPGLIKRRAAERALFLTVS